MENENENKNEGNPFRCKGSFTRGTACGECVRCQERGYTVESKAEAIEVEAERTKDLPADRVKTDETQAPVINVTVEAPVAEVIEVAPAPVEEEPVLTQPDTL